jgi:hypothetical protein
MNKDFTLYPEAFELKQLGFDEPCLKFYTEGKTLLLDSHLWDIKKEVLAPTYSQAFRFFREKYRLNYKIEEVSQARFQGRVYKGDGWATWDFGYKFNTYEEAELACLKKLIEIVNGGNK